MAKIGETFAWLVKVPIVVGEHEIFKSSLNEIIKSSNEHLDHSKLHDAHTACFSEREERRDRKALAAACMVMRPRAGDSSNGLVQLDPCSTPKIFASMGRVKGISKQGPPKDRFLLIYE